jgi:transcriptional regulator with XRE-family HTH domain
MGKKLQDHVSAGISAFNEAAAVLMKIKGIESDSELARLVEKKIHDGPSRKTVNNALTGRHDSQISTLQAIADALDCPLWVMFLTDRKDSDLESPTREQLIAVVQNYLKCDTEGRHHVAGMASAFAAKTGK